MGAKRGGDHDSGEPDPAAAMNRQPFAGPRPSLIDDGAKRGDKAAAETRGGGEIEALRQAHQIYVGEVDGDEFGEGAPMSEARLHLVVANVLVARIALWTSAAARNEGHRDAVALLPQPHILAHLLDDARKLVARHMGKLDVAVVAHPAVPIAAADA